MNAIDIKQAYNFEDFRVLSYKSIRNITVLVHAIAYFTSICIGVSLKLKVMVQKIIFLSKRIFCVPTFFNYAMADIFELKKHSRADPNQFKSRIEPKYVTFQLSLFPD